MGLFSLYFLRKWPDLDQLLLGRVSGTLHKPTGGVQEILDPIFGYGAEDARPRANLCCWNSGDFSVGFFWPQKVLRNTDCVCFSWSISCEGDTFVLALFVCVFELVTHKSGTMGKAAGDLNHSSRRLHLQVSLFHGELQAQVWRKKMAFGPFLARRTNSHWFLATS